MAAEERRILLLDLIDSLGNNDYLIVEDQHSDTGKTKIVRLSTMADYIRSGVSAEELEALIGLDPLKGSLESRLTQLGEADPAVQLLILTDPNGGEEWAVGTNHNITWTQQSLSGTVKLEYNTANGVGTWTEIATGIDVTLETYQWTIPSGISSVQCKVRISSIEFPALHDSSNSNFSITDSVVGEYITISAPMGSGISWRRGTTQSIVWASGGLSGTTVKIECLDESKVTATQYIATGVSATAGSYSWAIPHNMALGTYSIRITSETSTLDPATYDISSQFSIIANELIPTITLISPNGGDTLKGIATFTIKWSYTGFDGTEPVTISLIYDGGAKEYTLASPTVNITAVEDCEFSWTVNNINFDDCQIYIECGTMGGKHADDKSDAVFTISSTASEDSIIVTYPNSYVNLAINTPLIIEWEYTPSNPAQPVMPRAKIYLYDGLSDTSPIYIGDADCDDEYYSWTIPSGTPTGRDYYVVVASSLSGNSDASDAPFQILSGTGITPPPRIDITKIVHPKSGVVVALRSDYEIWFNHVGFPKKAHFDIFCSAYGGESNPDTWVRLTPTEGIPAIASPTETSQLFKWTDVGNTIPILNVGHHSGDIESSLCVIKVVYKEEPTVYKLSDGTFTVK
jgi:hypothetical protein